MKKNLSISVYCCGILFCLVNLKYASAQNSLTLDQAIKESYNADHKLRELAELYEMQLHLSEVKGELPNLTMSMSAKNLPTDNFNLSAEPMTQLAIGFTQKVPGGHKRELAKQLELNKSVVFLDKIRLRKKKISLAINGIWLDSVYFHHINELLIEQKQVLRNLLSVTQSLYSVGKRSQQDVFKAEVEIESIEEQLVEAEQNILVNKENFSLWLVPEQISSINASRYPTWYVSDNLITLRSRLVKHPLISIQQKNIATKRTQLKIAQESIKSDWSVGLSYSSRSGDNIDLSERSDFLSVNFSMDLPYLSSYRNDKTINASQNGLQSATFSKDDLLANLKRQLQISWKKSQSIEERLTIYKNKLLPKSEQRKQASLNAYQRDVVDFNDPMQALIQDLQLKRQYQKLNREFYQEKANIIYLAGEE